MSQTGKEKVPATFSFHSTMYFVIITLSKKMKVQIEVLCPDSTEKSLSLLKLKHHFKIILKFEFYDFALKEDLIVHLKPMH